MTVRSLRSHTLLSRSFDWYISISSLYITHMTDRHSACGLTRSPLFLCARLYILWVDLQTTINFRLITSSFIFTVLQQLFLISSLLDFIIHFSNLITFNTFQIVFKRPSLERHCNWGEHIEGSTLIHGWIGHIFSASHTLFNWFRRKFVCVCPPLSQFHAVHASLELFIDFWHFFSLLHLNSNSICHFHVRWKMVYYFHKFRQNFYLLFPTAIFEA